MAYNTVDVQMKRMITMTMILAVLYPAYIVSAAHALAMPPQGIASATNVRELSQRHISIDIRNVPLTGAINLIAQQAGLSASYDQAVIPNRKTVTLQMHDVSVVAAFQAALQGTGLIAEIRATGYIGIVRAAENFVITGGITGRVIDAKTGQPLRGVKIGLDGLERVVETSDDGRYRLTAVSAGTHTVSAKLIGYARAVHTVNITEGDAVTLDITLTFGANMLDQVVVTGTVIPTELKAVPSAITVITAKQIEERGITHIDQLFHGDVPGLFAQNLGSNAPLDQVTMYSRGVTSLDRNEVNTGRDIRFTNPIKTYVDGVEIADPSYLSQIDPKSIERIEILTGPQASTIYGSNAINGVMQIFTKRGTTSTPQLTLNLLSGWVENNFSSAHTPQHDDNAQLNGIEGKLSYNAGSSWNYIGPWTPAKQTTRISGFGGMRLELPTSLGRVTSDVTLRRSTTQNVERGFAAQAITKYRETGYYRTTGTAAGLTRPTTYTLNGQTLGLVVTYAPTSWWSHEGGVGMDASDVETRFTARGYASISDTTLRLQQDHTGRRSFHYATTAHLALLSAVQATVTAGTDAWQNIVSSLFVAPQALTGTLSGETVVSRLPGHNTGGFLQTQLGVQDHLFVTYGLRAEWNPGFGAAAQPNYAPRYGLSYVQEIGAVTAKVRASYGRSTRPPATSLKAAVSTADWDPVYTAPFGGNFDRIVANPELGPEYQQGGEGGLELYLGTRGSLVVTRYNQTVDGLIAMPPVDSVRTLQPCSDCFGDTQDANGYEYLYKYQNVNIGSIRNQGWELQGSVSTGPFTTKGTYSWTKSRTIGITPKYRAYFNANDYPQYQPGATFQYLPEHTWAIGVMYAHTRSSLGLNVAGTGQLVSNFNELYLTSLHSFIRLPQNLLRVSRFSYITFNSGYALADLTASHRLSSQVEGVLQVHNLTDHYTNDLGATLATMGRQTVLGLRVRL